MSILLLIMPKGKMLFVAKVTALLSRIDIGS